MTLPSLSLQVTSPACGLLGILLIWLVRGVFRKQWLMALPSALFLFLGAGLLPISAIFLFYPFIEPKPDLNAHIPLLPIVGLGLLWAVFASLKQGFDGK